MATPIEPTGIAALGLDLKALIFQIINFSLLLIILRLVAYKPILAMLERRRKTIEESLEKAKAIEEQEAKLQEKTQAILRQARVEATQIVKDAKQAGELLKNELSAEGKRQQEAIIAQTKQQIELEKQNMLTDAKRQLKYLVIAATAKVIEQKIDRENNEKLVTKTIKEIE